jgi:hypothetical protein
VTSKPISTRITPVEPEIDPIRVELLSTELPIHQLAKQREEDIRILKRDASGKVKLQWRVDYNPNVGHPGQLAYRLDTWVIKRRLNELRKPIPRLVRIGDLREIARALNHGGDTNAVRRAFDQNAATFIRAKLTYRTRGKGEETLEGYFNRYNVFYRGTPLPGDRRAETVYISLNDPYYSLLNRPEIRPLDFAYIRQLTPAAQRFYEILSPKVFAALTNGYPFAWIRYSEYCQYAVQKPQTTRSRMQAQMARVQGVHRRSGYIAAVKYRSSPTDDGSLDWIIQYVPGPRARSEYRFFNPARFAPERSKPGTDGITLRSGPKRSAQGTRTRNSASYEADPARQLARRFAERRHRALTVCNPTRRQIACARSILHDAGHDIEIAEATIDLAATEGRKAKNGFPADIAGVIEGGYLDRIRADHDRRETRRELDAQARTENERRARYDRWCNQRATERLASLSHDDRRRLVEERQPTFTATNRYLEKLPLNAQRKKAWIEDRILGEYAREGELTYEEWRRQHDSAPPH